MNKQRRKAIDILKETLSSALSDLEVLRDEEQEYFDNLMEQYLLEVMMDCQRSAYMLSSIVMEAQWKDPEHQAYMTARAEENRKVEEAKRLANEQANRDARKARRNANKRNV